MDLSLRPDLGSLRGSGVFGRQIVIGELSVSIGGQSFTVSGVESFVRHIDGPIALVAAGDVTITGKTPAVDTSSVLGETLNGMQLNPQLEEDHGYDSRRPRFDTQKLATLPLTLSAGDVLLASVSIAETVPRRNGQTNSYAMVYVTTTAPDADSLAPAAVGWTGRTGLDESDVDWDARVADLPSYALTGHTFTETGAELAAKARFNPAFAQFVDAFLGYEDAFPHDWVDGQSATNQNYGRYSAEEISKLMTALMTDQFNASEKKAILVALCSFGKQTMDTFYGANQRRGADGGHYQFLFGPAALYLWATGQTGRLDTFAADFGQNQFSQPFIVTQDMVENDFVPFGDADDLTDYTAKPYQFHRRRVVAISGTTVTLPTARGGAGGNQGDWSKSRFTGLVMTDGTLRATVTGDSGDVSAGENSDYEVTVDVNPGFTDTSIVWFEPQVPLVVGAADWSPISYASRKNWFNPSPTASYRNLQKWTGAYLCLKALSIPRDAQNDWIALEKYIDYSVIPDTPAVGYDYPSVHAGAWDTAMYDEHMREIYGLPPIPPVETNITVLSTLTGEQGGTSNGSYTLDLTTMGLSEGDLVIVTATSVSNSFRTIGISSTGWTTESVEWAGSNRISSIYGHKLMRAVPDAEVVFSGSVPGSQPFAWTARAFRNVASVADFTTDFNVNATSYDPPDLEVSTDGSVVVYAASMAHRSTGVDLTSDFLFDEATVQRSVGSYSLSMLTGYDASDAGTYAPGTLSAVGAGDFTELTYAVFVLNEAT